MNLTFGIGLTSLLNSCSGLCTFTCTVPTTITITGRILLFYSIQVDGGGLVTVDGSQGEWQAQVGARELKGKRRRGER